MVKPLLIAKHEDIELALLPALANRHGLITGATGTGKTVTLQLLAERFSNDRRAGVHGRREGRSVGPGGAGSVTPKLQERLRRWASRTGRRRQPGHLLGCVRRRRPPGAGDHFRHGAAAAGAPAEPQRHPGRRAATGVQDCRRQGPAAARPEGPARHGAARRRERQEFTTEYGNVSAASIGAIQRGLLTLGEQGGDKFFGEPMLDIADLMQTDDGRAWSTSSPPTS
jgi:hypothetical protein